ncbi:MAG: hypothetical protein R3C32_08925 [Chloroflexota bacterium]
MAADHEAACHFAERTSELSERQAAEASEQVAAAPAAAGGIGTAAASDPTPDA